MRFHVFVMTSVAVSLASSASAQLDGHTLTADWYFDSFGVSIETHDVIVGPGIELDPITIVNDDKFSIDIAGDTVTFLFNATSNWTEVSFNGWHFADTNGTIPEILGYTVDSFSGGIGNVGEVTTGNTGDAFWADFGGMTVAGDGDFITLRVTFVPAPAAALPLGLAALALRRRR
jgi:hypothetical protein